MRVFVTQEIDPEGLDVLHAAGLEVDMRVSEMPIDRGELLEGVVGSDALIVMPTERVDAAVLTSAGPQLQIVANHAVGTDNIDLSATRAAGVPVTNTPGVLTDATADLAMALLLAAARHVATADRYVRRGDFKGWRPTLFRGLELRGARLGIVGLGRIGQATAVRARAFGMEVVHCSRSSGIPLEELLRTCDVVSLHCPLTPATRHLIGARELAWMKPTAVLVNTARGPVVDEAALARALAQGTIAAAGLDVFEAEPVVHLALMNLDNVVLAPHLGSATFVARRKMALLATRNVVAVLGGGSALNPV